MQIEKYILACASTPKASDEHIVPYKRMPHSLELGDDFLAILKMMQEETNKYNLEHFVHLGANPDRSSIFVSNNPLIGNEDEIPGESINEIQREIEDTGAVVSGHFHTHPDGSLIFSGGDVFSFISSSWEEFPIHMMGLVAQNEVLIALKSREGLDKYPNWLISSLFSEPWYKRYNVFNPDRSINFENAWKMNLGIARWYKFGLYKGRLGERLLRR